MQQDSIDSKNNPNIFLSASAGSGKTFALCVHYIALLFKGARANEILTLTFTKKAANEMKERITNNLFLLYKTRNITLNDAKAPFHEKILRTKQELLHALESYGLNAHDIHARIAHVYRHFLQADKKINTIDSFFMSILRKFAFFIGIRRDFQLQEEYKKDEAFLYFLHNAYSDPATRETMQFLLQELELHIDVPYSQNTLTLKTLLAMLHERFIDFHTLQDFYSKMNLDFILQKHANIFTELSLNYKETSLHTLECEICKYAKLLSQYLKDIAPEKQNKNLEKIYKELESKKVVKILGHKLILDKTHKFIMQSIKPNELMQQQIHDLASHIYKLGMLYYAYLEGQQLFCITKLFETYRQSIQHIETATNTLTFHSIGHKVFNIATNTLQEHNTFQSDYLYFRLDSTISHILFDEYQDTNRMQYRIFLPLFKEILAGSGTKDSKTLFFVGDSKQSLYAFRGASTHIFEVTRAQKRLSQKTLQHNYRSKKNIIDFVNKKFTPIFKENYESQIYSNHSLEHEGMVKIHLYEGDDKNKIEEKNKFKRIIFTDMLEQIQNLIQHNVAKKEIAILAGKREILREFIAFSKEKKYAFNFNLDKGGKLIHQRTILTIYYAIKINQWKNKLKKYQALNTVNKHEEQENVSIQEDNKKLLATYYNNIKFAQKKLNKLLGKSYFEDQDISIPRQKNLALTIKFIIEHFCLYNQDCMELLEVASANPDIKSIDALFEKLQDTDSKFLLEEAINAMTVHASKGLGFEYVLYLDVEKHEIKPDKILYQYDEQGIFLDEIRLNNTQNYQDESLQALFQKTQEDAREQKYNALYVACTRAKNGLYIFANTQSHACTSLRLSMDDSCGDICSAKALESQKAPTEQIIISALSHAKTLQEEFLISSEERLYQNTIAMQYKQIIGISLHFFLELILNYKPTNPLSIVKSQYGFYLGEKELEKLLQQAQNIFHTKLQKTVDFSKNMVKCEISFLQENSIKRLDAIVQHRDGIIVIEFKSSQRISEALLRKHKTQLQSYMNFIENIVQKTTQISGYLVYLQDNVEVREIISES